LAGASVAVSVLALFTFLTLFGSLFSKANPLLSRMSSSLKSSPSLGVGCITCITPLPPSSFDAPSRDPKPTATYSSRDAFLRSIPEIRASPPTP